VVRNLTDPVSKITVKGEGAPESVSVYNAHGGGIYDDVVVKAVK